MNVICDICNTYPEEDVPGGYWPRIGLFKIWFVPPFEDKVVLNWLCALHLRAAQQNSQLPDHDIDKWCLRCEPAPD